MLKHLAGDVQTQILTVNNAADETEAIAQQLGALIHNDHAAGIELETGLEITGIIIIRHGGGNKEHCLIADSAFRVYSDDGKRLFRIVELFFIECLAVFVANLALCALPDGDHTVDGLLLPDFYKLALGFAVFVNFTGFAGFIAFHIHNNGPADIIGIFLNKLFKAEGVQILAVFFVLSILFYVHYNICTHTLLLRFAYGVAVSAAAFPLICALTAVGAGNYGHLVADHKCGIEAHAELTDDIYIGLLRLFLAEFAFELERAAAGNNTQIVLHILPVHTYAVIGDANCACILIHFDTDTEILSCYSHSIVGEGNVAELIYCIGRIGYDLTKENFLVGID